MRKIRLILALFVALFIVMITRFGFALFGAIFSCLGMFYTWSHLGWVWPETFAIFVFGIYTVIDCLHGIPMRILRNVQYKKSKNESNVGDNILMNKTLHWNQYSTVIQPFKFYEGISVFVVSILFVESHKKWKLIESFLEYYW